MFGMLQVYQYRFVSGVEKRGHFDPDLNFEELICIAWIHFYACLYKLPWPTAKPKKSLLKISEGIAGLYSRSLWFECLGGRKCSLGPKLSQKVGQGLNVDDDVIKLIFAYLSN